MRVMIVLFWMIVVVQAAALLCGGCQAWDGVRETKTAEFVEWLEEESPAASEIAVRDGIVTLTKADGSAVTRELPGAAEADNPGAVFGDKALAAIRKSMETGSPWPAVIGIAEAAALALVGGYAAKKRKAAAAASQLAETRTAQVDAMILGIQDAKITLTGSHTHARQSVAGRIQHRAKVAGVEDGPNGLKARVEELGSNVMEGT